MPDTLVASIYSMETSNTQDREHITKETGNHQERQGSAIVESGTTPNVEDDTSTTEGQESQASEMLPERPGMISTSGDEWRKDGGGQNQRQPQQIPIGDTLEQRRGASEEKETKINGYTEFQQKSAEHNNTHGRPAANSPGQELGGQFAAGERSPTEDEKKREEFAAGSNSQDKDDIGDTGPAIIEHLSAIEVQEKLNRYLGEVQLEMTRLNRALFQRHDKETIALRHQMVNLSRAIEMVGVVKLDNTEDLRRQHLIELAVERERNKLLGTQIHNERIKRDELKEKFKVKEAAKEADYTLKLEKLKEELRQSKTKIHRIKESHKEDMKRMGNALSSLADARMGLTRLVKD